MSDLNPISPEVREAVAVAIRRAFYENGIQHKDGLWDEDAMLLADAALKALAEGSDTVSIPVGRPRHSELEK